MDFPALSETWCHSFLGDRQQIKSENLEVTDGGFLGAVC